MEAKQDKLLGLSAKAIRFLKTNEIPIKVCPCCLRPFPNEHKVIGTYTGATGDVYPLYRHILECGDAADEFLQESPWNDGPVFFLGLRYGKKEITWTQKQIQAELI